MRPDIEYRLASRLHSVELDGEVLVWDGEREQLHRLNRSASQVWFALSSWRTKDDVAGWLGSRHGSARRIQSDVERCLADLVAAHLVEVRDCSTC
jgi:hypothetical protein